MKSTFSFFALVVLASSAWAHPGVDFTIVPRTRYMLSYTWEATGYPDVAAGPKGQWNVINNRWPAGPYQELEFFGPETEAKKGGRVRRFQPLLPGSSGVWKHEFYAPAGKVKMTLSAPDNKKNGKIVKLSNIKLEEVKDAPTLNVNPDFALGLYNYSGIDGVNGGDAVMLKNPEGGNSFFGSMSFGLLPTPIVGGRKYRIEYTGRGNHKSRIDPYMDFSGSGRKFARVDLPRVNRDDKHPEKSGSRTYEFQAPEGAEWVSFCFYYATLDSFRLTEIK